MLEIYTFGKFVLDTRERTLSAGGGMIHLPPKCYDLLQILIENNHNLLSKKELMSALWQDTFVEESNLSQYVSRLRKILNVDGNEYIRTVPKRGYRFSATIDPSASSARRTVRQREVEINNHAPHSLAVLPLQPLGSEIDEEFLGLGIADALITQITQSGMIVVRPTVAVRKYVNQVHDLRQIAETLRVDAVLHGSFQVGRGRIRLNVQMLDAASDNILWAESLKAEIDDIFDLQDEIAAKLCTALSHRLSSDFRLESAKRYTENTEAYKEYLRGRVNFSKRTGEGLEIALKHFEHAIEIDPLYALAYAGISDVYQLMPLSDEAQPHSALKKAKAAVLRALEIDADMPEAHLSLAVILMHYDWNFDGAELSFKQAIELNPNHADSHLMYGTLLLRLRRQSEALNEFRHAQMLDPLSASTSTWLAEALADVGELEASIDLLTETLRFAPEYSLAHYFLVVTYLRAGRVPEALKAAEHALKVSDDVSLVRSAMILANAHAGNTEAAFSELGQLIRKKELGYLSAVNIASGFAALKRSDEVFEWLNIALKERDSHLTWLNSDFEFQYLRDDPRFTEIVRRVNLI